MEIFKSEEKFEKVYSDIQVELIEKEFKRLQGCIYLEHAGATLYSEKQISDTFSELSNNIFANPHARNLSSKLTEDVIDQVRYDILEHFGTDAEDYSVIFTSGATGALKLVAEAFSYGNDGCESEVGSFIYLQDNHTSVLGMRGCASDVHVMCREEALKVFAQKHERKQETNNINSLFAYPAQCNFSGTKYPLTWIEKVQNGCLNGFKDVYSRNWFVLLDAASFAATCPLNLAKYKPDFVPLSFYKLFGYPTGIGALLVKNSSAHVLRKKYFGGGTVLMALSTENTTVPRPNLHERFEDGTVPFLSIVALKHGLKTFKRLNLTMEIISKHTFSLAKYVHHSLNTFRHSNGNPVVILYHDTNFESVNSQGGIINFNLLRANGNYVGYSEVLHFANLYGIHLRTGCFCNPGACQRHLHLTSEEVKYHFQQGHVCGDQNDLIDGYPTGSVRISFGYMSRVEDADSFLKMIVDCFVEASNKKTTEKDNNSSNTQKTGNKKTFAAHKGCLEHIFLYPVKSCGAFLVTKEWQLTSTGLKYDRQWMVVNSAGVCISQKQDTRLCLIMPEIDTENDKLHLHFEGCRSISLPLSSDSAQEKIAFPCQSKVCGDRIQGWDCGNEVADWLTDILGYPGIRLLRQCDNDQMISRSSKKGSQPQLSLANQAQFLLINTASVQWLLDRIPENNFRDTLEEAIMRFRPNFVVRFAKPFAENNFEELHIEDVIFKYDKQCTRCQMICIDQSTGEKTLEPLKTLSTELAGKIKFGVYLKREENWEDVVVSRESDVIIK